MRGRLRTSRELDGLPGAPAQPFEQRLALRSRSSAPALLDFLTMATSACVVLLLGKTAAGTAGLHQGVLAAYACLAAASLAHHCLACPSPSAAALKRQQALSMLLRLGWLACRAAMETMPLPWRGAASAGIAWSGDQKGGDSLLPWLAALLCHALQLLVSSSALCMLLQGLRRIPISLSIPMQLMMLAASSLQAPTACATGPLAAPAAQELTHRLYRWLRPLVFCTPLPLSLVARQDAAGECRAMLRFLQAALGTVLPLAWQAVAEGRLFARHQAQRAAAGLPPERGANAATLSAVGGLLHEVLRPHLLIFAVCLTGSLWDWSCLLSAPTAGAA